MPNKLWVAFATTWTSMKEKTPSSLIAVRDALDRIRHGKNAEHWAGPIKVSEVPGLTGAFLITVPPRWEQALDDPNDGYVEIEVRAIPKVGTVKLCINRMVQLGTYGIQ